jgi:hypothetical protein
MVVGGYIYDISQLPSSYLFLLNDTVSSVVDFAFCQPTSCEGSKAFVFLKENNNCHSYSSNPKVI